MVRTALHVGVVCLVLTAGCSTAGPDDPVRESQAVEALQDARERARTVATYRYDLSMSAAGGSERVSVEVTGRVNATARTMAAETSAGGETLAAYVDGDTAYQQCPPMGAFWGEQNVTAGNWSEVGPLGRQLALLSTGDLYWNGTGTVDGREAVHISGHPSLDALRERSSVGSAPLPDGNNVERVTVDAWIDADTSALRRSRISMTVTGNGETVTVDGTADFRAYGEPVRVSVPAEARDAFHEGGCPGS
jgi:hypothetical protein